MARSRRPASSWRAAAGTRTRRTAWKGAVATGVLTFPGHCKGVKTVKAQQLWFHILNALMETGTQHMSKTVKAQLLWFHILNALMETGTPYRYKAQPYRYKAQLLWFHILYALMETGTQYMPKAQLL